MTGEPRFGEWKVEASISDSDKTADSAEQGAERSNTFEYSNVQLLAEPREIDPQNEPALANQIVHEREACQKLNQGEKFALVFGDPVNPAGISIVEGRMTYGNSFYDEAYIILNDGLRISFSNFEAAAGLNFQRDMTEVWRSSNPNNDVDSEDPRVEKTTLETWLRSKFSEQFVGVIEPKHRVEPDAHDEADDQAISLIRSQLQALEGPESSVQ